MILNKMTVNGLILGCVILIQGGFGQVVTCEESKMNQGRPGPIYDWRPLEPPAHDLSKDPYPKPVHPGITLDVWHKPDDNFQVGGLAVLSNGEVIQLDYTGKIYHVTGLESAQTVTRRALNSDNLKEPLGLHVRNDSEVYVMTGDSKVWQFDWNGTDLTNKTELITFPPISGTYPWIGGLEGNEEYLYVNSGKRNSVSSYHFATETWKRDIGTANRNSHGIGIDSLGQAWFSDNQGNYRPSSPIFLLVEGKDYGIPMQGGTIGSNHWQFNLGPDPILDAYKDDLIWIPYPELSSSSTDIHFMKSGPFKGQALVGDNRTGHLNRLMLDKVDGQYQGSVVMMTGGLEGGNYSIAEHTDGTYYLGALGTPAPYFHWCNKYYGFQKMSFKTDVLGNTNYNDVYAVSLVRDGFVVEFTSDVSDDFLDIQNYRAYMFNYINAVNPRYGGEKKDSTEISITGIQKLRDRIIKIEMSGMLKESLMAFEFGDVLSNNNKLFTTELYYTMNHLSTRSHEEIVPVTNRLRERVEFTHNNGVTWIEGLDKQNNKMEFYSVSGVKKQPKVEWNGNKLGLKTGNLSRGIYFLKIKSGKESFVKTILVER